MRVAIVYNEPKAIPHDLSEAGVLEQVRQIDGLLRDAGNQTVFFAADDTSQLIRFLESGSFDVIFNCCESLHGNSANEMNVAALFELFGVRFTGSSALALGVAHNKGIAKALFQAHGIPTTPYMVLPPNSSITAARSIDFPIIVKPVSEDASIGIDTSSVVWDQQALAQRVRFVWDQFRQPALVEEFVDGREFNVAILAISENETIALPVSEILFHQLPTGVPRIFTYEAKWLTQSPMYESTESKCPADIPVELQQRLCNIALKAAGVIGLRDYGRIDLRLRTSDESIFVLEANPNPDITADSCLVRAAQMTGRSHRDVVLQILERAIERGLEKISTTQ